MIHHRQTSEIVGVFRAAMIMLKTATNNTNKNRTNNKGGDYLKNIRNKMDVYDDILIFIVVVGTSLIFII
jgi:hypothetical protein